MSLTETCLPGLSFLFGYRLSRPDKQPPHPFISLYCAASVEKRDGVVTHSSPSEAAHGVNRGGWSGSSDGSAIVDRVLVCMKGPGEMSVAGLAGAFGDLLAESSFFETDLGFFDF